MALQTMALVVLNFAVATVGIGGNIFVLYASRCHGALKIDKISVIYLESLAVSDVLMSMFVYLTSGIALLLKSWVFGAEFCYFCTVVSISATYNETLGIAVISLYRVWMLRKPPGARQDINMKLVYLSVASLYFVGVVVILVLYLVTQGHWTLFTEGEGSSTCTFEDVFNIQQATVNRSSSDDYLQDISVISALPTIFFVFVPLLITLSTTALIFKVFLGYDHKMGRKHDRAFRVIKLLLFVCVTFVLSYTPLIMVSVYGLSGKSVPPFLARSVKYFIAINVISNPFIYVIISPHFRGYLRQCTMNVRTCFAKRRPPVESIEKHSSMFRRHSTFRKSEDIVANELSTG